MSHGAVHNHPMFNFPPELIQHTAKFVANDPNVDNETLKACSLTFKGLAHLFQHVLTSRYSEPEIIISRDYPNDLYDKKFRALIDILKVNPSFAASVSRVKVTITATDEGQVETAIPDDSEVYGLLSLLTRISSFSVGSVSVDFDMEGRPSSEHVLAWTQIPDELRTVLEGFIQSPLLQALEIRLMSVPWSTFFGSRKTLDRLSLRRVIADSDSAGLPTVPPTFITIRHLDACQWSATDLNKVIPPMINPPIHIGKIQTLEVFVPRADKFGADFCDVAAVLHQPELKLQELIVRTEGMYFCSHPRFK